MSMAAAAHIRMAGPPPTLTPLCLGKTWTYAGAHARLTGQPAHRTLRAPAQAAHSDASLAQAPAGPYRGASCTLSLVISRFLISMWAYLSFFLPPQLVPMLRAVCAREMCGVWTGERQLLPPIARFEAPRNNVGSRTRRHSIAMIFDGWCRDEFRFSSLAYCQHGDGASLQMLGDGDRSWF